MVYRSDPMKDKKGYLTKEQVMHLLGVARQHNYRDYMLVKTLIYTGRRVSEIVNKLRPCDIDFHGKNITYKILKKEPLTKEEKTAKIPRPPPIPISLPANPLLLNELKKYIQNESIIQDQPIFPITRQRAYQIVERLRYLSNITSVGNKPLHPHHFRHTFAVLATQNKKMRPEDLIELQKALQHSSIETTMTYLQFGQTRLRSMVNSLNFES